MSEKPIKILNLYAGIGGNRKLWDEVVDVEVTAVEIEEEIANIYQDFFPNDKIVIGDAHKYLKEHYEDFDFIWSSPPCPTHSVVNGYLHAQGVRRYPDMDLYQEIIYLKNFFGGKWCVENVMSYYEPLIEPQILNRHYFWTNFYIKNNFEYNDFNTINANSNTRQDTDENLKKLRNLYRFNLSDNNISKTKEIKLLRNCVRPKLGKYILKSAFKDKQQTLKMLADGGSG